MHGSCNMWRTNEYLCTIHLTTTRLQTTILIGNEYAMLLLFVFLPKQEFTTNCQNCKFKEQQLPIYSITSLPFLTEKEVGTVTIS